MIVPVSFVEAVRAWVSEKYVRALVFIHEYRQARAKRNHKCLWRCLRDGGGGQLITPKPMTQEHAVAWIGRVVNGEVFHVDFENRFIFYRSHR